MFCNENWSYKIREDLNFNSDDFQLLWAEVDKDSSLTKTNLLVGTIYRRPGSNPSEFIEKLQTILSIINDEKTGNSAHGRL
jgi:hypothetical protein